MEKASQQLEEIYLIKTTLAKIKRDDTSEVVKLGSLVITNQVSYFLAISAGEIKIDTEKYYAISPNSPIGKLLLGKEVDDTMVFNGREIAVQSIF